MAAASSTKAPAVLSPSMDYSSAAAELPDIYSTSVVFPTVGSSTTLNNGGETSFTLELPVKTVYNLHNSILKGVYTTPPANAGTALFMGWVPPFARIQLVSQSGTRIFDIAYNTPYNVFMRKNQIAMKDFLQKDLLNWGNPCAVPRDDIAAAIPSTPAIPDVASAERPGVSVSAVQLEDMKAPLLMRSFPVGSAAQSIPFAFKLGDLIPHSSFGHKGDVEYPEKMNLTVTIMNSDNLVWCATSQSDCQTGTALCTSKVHSLTNFHLDLQLQQNPEHVKITRAVFREGFQMAVPFVQSYSYSITGGSTALGLNIPISVVGISEIREITWGLTGQTYPWRTFDFSNIDSGTYQRLLSYRTAVDATTLQAQDLNCTSSQTVGTGPYTDYEYNKLGDNPMTLSRLTYQQCWFHTDDFRKLKKPGEFYSVDKVAIHGGLPFGGTASSTIQYKIQGTLQPGALSEALTLWLFVVGTATIRWTGTRIESFV